MNCSHLLGRASRCTVLFLALIAGNTVWGSPALDLEAELGLPDFSYAGYRQLAEPLPRMKGPVFDVTEFGAVPDDGKPDRAEIQLAVDAAQAAGGGVVYFPAGTFDLNANHDVEPLRISGSNIVLRGAGAEEGGTVLFQKLAMPPPPPMRLWASPYAVQIVTPHAAEPIADIAADVPRGSFRVPVSHVGDLAAGDWISLVLEDNSPALVESELAALQRIDPRWKSIIQDGVTVNERHQIESIDGDVLVLTTPVIKAIEAQWNWRVERFTPLVEMGVEAIRFEGNWHDVFVHHKNWLHDGGYSLLRMQGVVNSWIRDCVFVNVSRAGSITDSAHVTVQDSRIEGVGGHNAIAFPRSSFCLMMRVQDLAPSWHSIGVSKNSIGNVFWESYWESTTCFESHSSQPRVTLFDSCVGGFMKGRAGGSANNLPNHLEELVFWNHLKTNPPLEDFQFEPLDEIYWKFLPPTIVGMHGTPITFRDGQARVHHHGSPVDGSLFVEQAKRRLGEMPAALR